MSTMSQGVGVGCALGATEMNEVMVKGLVHGGPCHLSCQVGVGDIVISVDGTPVGGDVKLAKQVLREQRRREE